MSVGCVDETGARGRRSGQWLGAIQSEICVGNGLLPAGVPKENLVPHIVDALRERYWPRRRQLPRDPHVKVEPELLAHKGGPQQLIVGRTRPVVVQDLHVRGHRVDGPTLWW